MEYITFKTKHPAGHMIVYNNEFHFVKQTNLKAGNCLFDEEGNLYIPDLSRNPNNELNHFGSKEPLIWNDSIHNILEDKTIEPTGKETPEKKPTNQ